MNVLLLNTFDLVGGAARAAFRLHKGLQNIGIKSRMLVQVKSSDDPTVTGPQSIMGKMLGQKRVREILDSLPLRIYLKRQDIGFSPAVLPERIRYRMSALRPDLIHLHWISYGFMRLETLKNIQMPLVWTLHDMWAFTGGCHYDQGCSRYQESCGRCPILGSAKENDLSRRVWERKQKSWQDINLVAVAPSQWMANCARASSLFHDIQMEIIPNGIDLTTFVPFNKKAARQRLSLPQNKGLILFGAIGSTGNKRKGFNFLKPALQGLADDGWNKEAELVIFGQSAPKDAPDLDFRCHYIGRIQDDTMLAGLYAAADLFVAPSTQDNLPNTVMEALACGTPCVAFNVGGMPDMIEHKSNGYLAKPFNTDQLAEGIAWVLDDERKGTLSKRAHTKVKQQFEISSIARRYLNLYERILAV